MNPDFYDMVIIGAGLSGIGMACHLARKCPDKRYLILESRGTMGGTWDLFRYPGIRSDSDMFTFGYSFKPWISSQNLADGPAILNYIREAAEEYGVNEHIRYGALVQSISWSSDGCAWTVRYTDGATGDERQVQCRFINGCTGYYNYERGYEPPFSGSETFQGQIIHPQKWPEHLDYRGKRVVVIGSGATAVTIVPEMARDAAHVTMLQRSPTFMASLPEEDRLTAFLRKRLPEMWVYRVARTSHVGLAALFYNLCRRFPNRMKKFLLKQVARELGPEVDMKHFTPRYNPWDERFCAVKGGDLFLAVKEGRVSVVTDHIDRFTAGGIRLQSGSELAADIIVTATGLDLKFFGGITIDVDGAPYDHTQKMCYKAVMLEDLPNLGFTFGYTNSSWTLKADITSEWICRVLKHMDATGRPCAVPVNNDPTVQPGHFLDFQSGYIQRGLHRFPKMGNKPPWRLKQLYPYDLLMLRYSKLEDGVLQFRSAAQRKTA
ncbi:MAG: NAD(P)/FAD-dependent oxidoreductase, partial [Candidatus Hydrogenedentes bacterium]|nr:NAD(P)/FAD-dependent oxidoreductase [Candidatus Hydrogenedentota bacterium]